jgi:lysophospholipase L1-like esterase
MGSSPKEQEFQRYLFAAYLLLWPPFVVLLLRRSGSPDVLDRWSWRLFGVLLAYVLVLAVATVVACIRSPGARVRQWVLVGIVAARRRRFLFGLLCLMPVILAGLAWGAMRWIGVMPDAGVVLSIFDAALLAGLCVLIVVLAGQPIEYQRQLNKRLALAVGATVVTMAAVELAAVVLGVGAYATWDINPKRLDIRFETDDFDVRVVTNRQGLREPAEVPRRHPGVFRVLAIGDSMTFGWGVEYEQSYPQVAQRQLRGSYGWPGVEVINVGRPGAGPHDYLAYMRKYAVELDPDVIVIGFLIGNDCPVRAPASLSDRAAVERELAGYAAASRQSPAERWLLRSFFARLCYAGIAWPRPLPADAVGRPGPIFREPNPLDPRGLERDIAALRDAAAGRERYASLLRGGWVEKGLEWRVNPWLVRAMILHPAGAADSLAVRGETREVMQFEWQLCAGLLRECKAASDEQDVPLVVLAIPNAQLVSQCWVDFLAARGCLVTSDMTTSRVVNDWLAETCRDNGIVCVDPLEQFRREERAGTILYLKTDDHMTPRGQQLLGESLAAALDPMIAASTGGR